jgi:hypothetical protein
MIQHKYKNLIIDVFDEPTYEFGPAYNNFNYSKHHSGEGGPERPSANHGVRIFSGEKEIRNCIINGYGGATIVHENSSLVDKDQLLICCCNTVFCLTIPDLEIKWNTRADRITCFKIVKLHDDYLVHGELQICRLDRNGNIIWTFGGADIFVSVDGEEEFKIGADHILLTDFSKTKYKLGFDGKLIWDTYNKQDKSTGNATLHGPVRTWINKLFGNQ